MTAADRGFARVGRVAMEMGLAAIVDGKAVDGQAEPAWARIASEIAAAISRGELADGETLPAAAQVAARHGVNRHTARQAYLHLQDLGLVRVERGRGTTVRATRLPYRIGRKVSFRANIGAAGKTASGQVLESSLIVADAETAAGLGIAEGAPVWSIRTLSRAAGVPVSASVHRLCATRFEAFDLRLRRCKASPSAAFASYGYDGYERLSTRLSAALATSEEAAMLEIAKGAAILRSAAVDGMPDGTVLQLVDAAFVGDRVEMVIEQAG